LYNLSSQSVFLISFNYTLALQTTQTDMQNTKITENH